MPVRKAMIRKAVDVMSGKRRADVVEIRMSYVNQGYVDQGYMDQGYMDQKSGRGRNLRECYVSLKKTKTGFDHQKCKPE